MTSSHPSLPASVSSSRSLHRPELLAPAGNWECAKAAVENGADAIYFGLDRFNARMRAENFTTADLPDLMAFLHQRGVKGYVTLNTLVFTDELDAATQYLREVITAGVDAVIVQDVGICRLIRQLSPDFPIHASTQMTVTSATGVEFARSLGCNLVVLARECSIQDINKIQSQLAASNTPLPLEVFVHGALCVAYSGQCLTSESLGGRSANRGECAQACRMTYDLIADGELVNLGDRRYLLSPQDLAGLNALPDLVQSGVVSLKIEGRLKAPEYVANVTCTYRQALDRVMAQLESTQTAAAEFRVSAEEQYNLEMAFSRGLHTGWLHGIDNQRLVHARFGKKRGVYLGEVTQIRGDRITLQLQAPAKPGDGVVFDNGHPDAREEGGRIYSIDYQGTTATLRFGRDSLNLKRIHIGDQVWKTSDPELDRQLRQSYSGDTPHFQRPICVEVHGVEGQPLTAIWRDNAGHVVQTESSMPLVAAHSKPLTTEKLRDQLGRLGNTPFQLTSLDNCLDGKLLLPVSELNRIRREAVEQLEVARSQPQRWQLHSPVSWRSLLPNVSAHSPNADVELIVLVRTLEQLDAAIAEQVTTLYCEFEDPRLYRTAVQRVQQYRHALSNSNDNSTVINAPRPTIWVAPPRITKPAENWILQQVRASNADGYLVRNYDHLGYFADQPCIGDFSLNIANPLTAAWFKQYGLARLTASYDLNIDQLEALLTYCPTDWLEVTVHQHMPMFHMEHCVFCAFLSEGTDYTNCGRPCETHQVKLRDRIGTEHILQADAGCRNTVFNGKAQTGAEYLHRLLKLGLRYVRIEFVNESGPSARQTIQHYRQLLSGTITGSQLWRTLQLQSQLGVTRGPMDARNL